jgi:sulfite reductase (ferredoxin)
MAKDSPGDVVSLASSDLSQMSKVERLKVQSEGFFYVAGKQKVPFANELDDLGSGARPTISGEAKEIAKHFGIYKQQGRSATGSKTGDYIFMVRIKNPAGGELSPEQWEALCEAADRYADGTLRLTTRQGIQFHHVRGPELGPLVRHLNQEYADRGYRMTTLGACGDVNRNTMCSPIDDLDAELPLQSSEIAHAIARELAPQAGAASYYQIFLSDDEGRTIAPMSREEPIYGQQYMPRKFKIGIAHPSDNSVDLLTQDIGFMPVVNGAIAEEYDLYSGGGLGITHNAPQTQQHLGLYLGRIPRDQAVHTALALAQIQKENGERKDRRQARWKYTIRRLGVEAVKRTLRERFRIELKDAKAQPLPPVRYYHGWHREAGDEERYMLGVPVENGRLQDRGEQRLKTAVREIVKEHGLGIRITPNQDLLLCHVPAARREHVERALTEHGVGSFESVSRVRRQSFACPAKPTCGLAMTDAENILPEYVQALEQAGYGDVDVIIRMAGCPNSCSRPPTAEIGIYGYGKNDHVIQVGGSREGTRIGKILYDRVPEEKMRELLIGLCRAIRDHNPRSLAAGEYLYETPSEELRRIVGLEL